jgi:hypothetical protein
MMLFDGSTTYRAINMILVKMGSRLSKDWMNYKNLSDILGSTGNVIELIGKMG